MRFRFILSETWNSLKRNVSMIISVMLVTFISFLFIGVSGPGIVTPDMVRSMADKPIIFAYHGYPTLIHELTYRRHNRNLPGGVLLVGQGAFQPGDRRSGERDQRGSRQHRLQNHICEP